MGAPCAAPRCDGLVSAAAGDVNRHASLLHGRRGRRLFDASNAAAFTFASACSSRFQPAAASSGTTPRQRGFRVGISLSVASEQFHDGLRRGRLRVIESECSA
jgi:hypothetical protein